VGQKSETYKPGEAGGGRSDHAAVDGPMADGENGARKRQGGGARAFPTLPIAQSAIGKVHRARFRLGARNGSPSSAPESLSHSYVDSSRLDLAGRPAAVSLAVALLSFASRRPAPRRTALLLASAPLAPHAPCALDRLRAGCSASAPIPPHPHARSSGARIKSERNAR
jgi:hypothetical protein